MDFNRAHVNMLIMTLRSVGWKHKNVIITT